MSALLSIERVSKRFGGLTAVSEVSFAVPEGAIYSVIGPNGAGKTTLFNMISALFPPSEGAIVFDGQAVHRARTHQLARLGIGRTFQNLAIFSHATVVQNLLVGMHHALKANLLSAALFWGPARREELAARRRVEEIIDFLEIEHLRDLPVGLLSYGLQKRVELGRALAVGPKLLLLDEMVSGMNAEETEDIARFILDIRDELGVTVVMVEHDMGIVMDISDRIAVLNHGSLIAEGTPAEIAADPAVIQAYLGRN
ncbi:amino acid/amide ABC transporter ATP-binding protein 1, HAAT family [Tistlia consotensis]|uniref:Amino acid/amide ABC transporter ATP-binding protein 1, HAAT family n=1 Tax=Tistlia consotensis USBA 355 TaxID=560819 RepID=A0A1Y6BF59_9PROT|nr:ABC transporter ATP-binding protein [Tistlia consotensis]SMF04537.1 amino acid/amide ABC transporter ATP-binding protein 1, HAAT family [Tistlia consotensis USBA 355]SNR54548.1 amino acid/amide ABC transporter ATP-binding protein 1, HAAT family [Tistlia consotensis]